jgi:serine/threonine-protein kinase RsbW
LGSFGVSRMADEHSNGCKDFDPDKLALKLKVTLAADRNAIEPVVQSIMEVVRNTQCATGKEDAIELALSEALANAVVHGAKGDPGKVVECDVACDEARGMLIVVRDPGPGFDPCSIPSPLVGENIYSNHGRGIFLINTLMDEVQFKNNGKEIHMLKKVNQPPVVK